MLDRTTISRDEEFSHVKGEVLINRQYDKRQSHCMAYCLEDCIRFEKTKTMAVSPHRNFVKYQFIKHIFIFQDKPYALMMCIDNPVKGRRTYEAFKCKRLEDVKTFCEMVYAAKQDEEYRLREGNAIGHVSMPSELSLADRHQSAVDITDMNGSDHEVFKAIEQMQLSAVEPVNGEYWNGTTAPGTLDSMLKNDMTKMGSDWDVSITYLTWDKSRGAVVNDCGPVYLYVARHLRPAQPIG